MLNKNIIHVNKIKINILKILLKSYNIICKKIKLLSNPLSNNESVKRKIQIINWK